MLVFNHLSIFAFFFRFKHSELGVNPELKPEKGKAAD